MQALIYGEGALRHKIEGALARRGHTVVTFTDREAALATHGRSPFPLVIIDWDRADSGAAFLCRGVRQLPDGDEPVILAITADDRPQRLAAILESGANDILGRPLEEARLLAHLMVAERRVAEAAMRRPTVEALRKAEERLRAVVNNAPIVLAALDRDGRFTLVEGEGLGKTGIDPDLILGKSAVELFGGMSMFDETGAATTPAAIFERVLGGSPAMATAQIGDIWLENRYVPMRDGNGEISGVISVSMDVTDRRRAEDAQQRSESQFHSFIERTPDAVFAHREDGTFCYANAAAVGLFGVGSADELIGHACFDFVHPDDQPGISERIRRTFTSGQSTPPRIHRFVRKDGTVVFTETRGIPVTFDGLPAAVVLARDLTERTRAEEALHVARERLRTIVQSAPVVLVAIDREGRFTLAEGAGLEAAGIRPEQLIGKSAIELFGNIETADHSGRVFTTTKMLERQLAGESVVGLAEWAGNWFEWRGGPLRDSHGEITGAIVVATNVTDRIRIDEERQRAQRQFEQLIQSMPDAIVLHSDNRIVYVNPAALLLFGCRDTSELIGKDPFELVHPDERESARLRIAGSTVQTTPVERRLLRFDGRSVTVDTVWLRVSFDGKPTMMGILRDVTETREIQSRLLLSERMASVGTLAAGVAHEINTPLSYVIANLSYASEHFGGADPEVRDALLEARQGAERVRHIVRDLKAFSRPNDERRGPIDLRVVLESSINMASNEIRHRAQLVRQFGDVPLVEANESRLGQVFLNLLINAAQAVPEGAAERNEIRVRTATDSSGRALVEVRDTGAGIAPEIKSHIFDPYFTTKPVGVGTGLGLAICHGIVHALGGVIEVESAVGQGSTFRVRLPPAREEQVPSEAPTRAPEAGRRGRILVVDDEPMIGVAVRRTLSSEHDVVAVSSAREALSQLSEGRFDLILCDLMMPEMTGMDMHARLVSSSSSRETEMAGRMIFLTGGAFTVRAKAFLDSVPNQRLEKPFEPQSLRALIRSLVG